jgi:purine-nucleoside phosphorylase
VKISELSKQLLIGTVYNPAKQTLSFKKGNLTFAPQSTLLNFTLKDGSEYSTKMKYAVIKQQSEHYVPFDEFVTALHSLGLHSIEKRGDNLYQIGKGINQLITSTFAIPDEMLDEEAGEETFDEYGSEEFKKEELIVSSGFTENQQVIKKQNEKKTAPKEKVLQAIVESADASNTEKCTITGISLEAIDDRYTIVFSSNIGL